MGSTASGGSEASLQASLRAVRAGPAREHARRDRVSGSCVDVSVSARAGAFGVESGPRPQVLSPST
jgi:hypothetical protein